MNMSEEKSIKKLVGLNALILAAAALISFILPLVLDSMLEGRGNFIKAMAHVVPVLLVIPVSCQLISKAGQVSQSEHSD